jgi:hypothetical protein
MAQLLQLETAENRIAKDLRVGAPDAASRPRPF